VLGTGWRPSSPGSNSPNRPYGWATRYSLDRVIVQNRPYVPIEQPGNAMSENDVVRDVLAGTDIPVLLQALREFENQQREWFSGYFELDTPRFADPAWFGGDRDAAGQIFVFGLGPDDSLYALWLHDGRSVVTAPVVFLGSEGTDCGVIANDLSDFLALLAIGAEELGYAISWGDVSESDTPARRLPEFRSWLADRLGISAPSDPSTLVRLAKDNHPDFQAWLDALHASDN
jgi:hypothetical protein